MAGGTINVTGATLQAPAGKIHLTSVAGTGEVPVAPGSASTVTAHGPISLTGGSTLDVSDPANHGTGGGIFLYGSALTVAASQINADNYGTGQNSRILLSGDSQVVLSGNANVQSFAHGSGPGATISIETTPVGAVSLDNSKVQTGSNTTTAVTATPAPAVRVSRSSLRRRMVRV